jgi:crotonobetainyl-CoA:carnitine CoA-transferase CaiB-like acyl-CoA transferase
VARDVPVGPGNHHPSIAPYGLFHAADAAIQVAVGSESQWRVFAPIVGLDPADLRFATNRDRVAHRAELIEAIDAALAAESAAEWLRRLDRAGVPAGRVRGLDEVYEWSQTRSQGLVISVEHPVLGRVELPGPPLRFGDRPYAGGRSHHLPPPALGEHDEAVRAWLAE